MKAVKNTYSLTEDHIMRVKEMAEDTGLSEGLIVRNAIDLLYEHCDKLHPVARRHQFGEFSEEPVLPADNVVRLSDLIG